MKKYNGEKAVISLTSWKARINTVHKTIENLLEMCPGFHICLTLSTEEFPHEELDLPDSLTALLNTDKFEIIWVKKNYKAFKKVLFAIMKYPQVPVISADDDCIYTENYAEKLYSAWVNCEKLHQIVGYNIDHGSWPYQFPCGPACLYPPGCFGPYGVGFISDKILESANDDLYYGILAFYMHIPFVNISYKTPFKFHVTNDGIGATPAQLVAARDLCVAEITRQIEEQREIARVQAEIKAKTDADYEEFLKNTKKKKLNSV